MDKKQVNPSTKDAALHKLGVLSAKRRRTLAGQLEFVQVRPGRQLLARGRLTPTVVIGVSGSALVTDHDGHTVRLAAPFFVDQWATDGRRVAEITVAVDVACSLILVDWRYRESVVAGIPSLSDLSERTHDNVKSSSREVIDLTEKPSTPESSPAQKPKRRTHVHS